MMSFDDYSILELIELIEDYHLNKKLSIRYIAKELNTYPLKVLRFCKKYNIHVMSAKESLKNVYANNETISKKTGMRLSEEQKRVLSDAQKKRWAKVTDEERERRRQVQREIFAKRKDKDSFPILGAQHIRKASKEGSKLEKFLIEKFEYEKIRHIHHYRGLFGNTQLEADFYLIDYNIILEIDGPSHFANHLTNFNYRKQLEADKKKDALVLKHGARIMRVRHTKQLYNDDFYKIYDNIIKKLDSKRKVIIINVN